MSKSNSEKNTKNANMKGFSENAAGPQDRIDRYVYEVIRRLPAKQRDDIEKELRSLIDDMLADQRAHAEESGAAQGQASLAEVDAVLIQLGSPYELAAKYRGHNRYLIGPDYFDMYILILKIVLAAVAFGLTLAIILQNLVTPPADLVSFFAEMFSGILNGLFQAFAWVTVIFAALSYFTDPAKIVRHSSAEGGKSPAWKPSDLPPVPSKKRVIPKSDPIVGIAFSVLAIILFNLFPQIIGIIFSNNGVSTFIPLFNLSSFGAFLPLFNILFVIGLVKELLKFFEGKYTLRLSVGLFILGVVSVVISLVIFMDPALWNPDFPALFTRIFPADVFDEGKLLSGLEIARRCLIGLIIFGFSIETITSFARAIRYARE